MHNVNNNVFIVTSENLISIICYILTFVTGHSNIIDIFGIKGNGFDRVTLLTYTGYSATILCGSSLPGVVLGWYFSNGTSVGNKNRNLREGNLVNGTRALQFGTFSGVSPCDSGVYICRANLTHSAKAEQRPFKVTVNSKL